MPQGDCDPTFDRDGLGHVQRHQRSHHGIDLSLENSTDDQCSLSSQQPTQFGSELSQCWSQDVGDDDIERVLHSIQAVQQDAPLVLDRIESRIGNRNGIGRRIDVDADGP